MNAIINVLTKFGLLKEDLEYHLIGASIVCHFRLGSEHQLS